MKMNILNGKTLMNLNRCYSNIAILSTIFPLPLTTREGQRRYGKQPNTTQNTFKALMKSATNQNKFFLRSSASKNLCTIQYILQLKLLNNFHTFVDVLWRMRPCQVQSCVHYSVAELQTSLLCLDVPIRQGQNFF